MSNYQWIEDPNKLILPVEVTNIIFSESAANLNILDNMTQIYGKALIGPGTAKFKNGNEYEGEFQNGMLHGKGYFLWSNGVKYNGDFEFNRITGKGKYEWPDGSWFEGDVVDGLRWGNGNYHGPEEEIIYEGEWEKGLRHGKGVLKHKSGYLLL